MVWQRKVFFQHFGCTKVHIMQMCVRAYEYAIDRFLRQWERRSAVHVLTPNVRNAVRFSRRRGHVGGGGADPGVCACGYVCACVCACVSVLRVWRWVVVVCACACAV